VGVLVDAVGNKAVAVVGAEAVAVVDSSSSSKAAEANEKVPNTNYIYKLCMTVCACN
jgi:hypothetical protein